MKFYLAKIVYQIVCGEGKHTPQFDEQLRLLQADSAVQALQKAKLLGSREEDSFQNDYQKLVQWKFVDVAELYQIDHHIDGAEIFSAVQETDNADGYKALIQEKANNLREALEASPAEIS